jgi:hypothetical protein
MDQEAAANEESPWHLVPGSRAAVTCATDGWIDFCVEGDEGSPRTQISAFKA